MGELKGHVDILCAQVLIDGSVPIIAKVEATLSGCNSRSVKTWLPGEKNVGIVDSCKPGLHVDVSE